MNHEPETLEHLHRINAQPLLELEGQTVFIKKIGEHRPGMIHMGETFAGTIRLLANDATMMVWVGREDGLRNEYLRTSIVVNVEPTDGGVLVHTLNSTYLVSKISEAQ